MEFAALDYIHLFVGYNMGACCLALGDLSASVILLGCE